MIDRVRLKRFLAATHLSQKLVCEMSSSDRDYHDAFDAAPFDYLGFASVCSCRHCGKEFINAAAYAGLSPTRRTT